jgi:arylsulfatase A-like enzyme/Flp pilus assembly protein TadD
MRLAPALASLFVLASCTRQPPQPNLILVSVDTLRADHLSCYGGRLVSTPAFDRIAEEGVLFENLSAVAPTTLPTHASLLTGVSPLEHWVHDNVGFRLRNDVPTLASALQEAGYRTGGFVGSVVLDSKFGLARGFEVYSDAMPETHAGIRERRALDVLEDGLRFIEEGDEPFFAFLHFFDPHRPYDPPPPFHPGDVDEKARYRGEVAYVDSVIGKLLAFLDARNLSSSTVVVVTADHGESLGEHGEDTHGFFLYQSTLHVPLLVRGPSVPRGLRVDSLARTIDVPTTALELLSIAPPPSFEGVSFLSRSGEIRRHEIEAYAETSIPRLHYGWSELRSLTRENWKLVLAPSSELYDLADDAGESRNLFDESAPVAKELREALLEMTGSKTVRPEPVDEKTLASLRALGYLGGAGSTEPLESSAELADPKDRIAIYTEILELSVVTKPTEATLDRLSAVLELDPSNPRALQLYGNALLELDRPRDALEAFERIEGRGFESLFGKGRALAELGEVTRARAAFEKALELDPASVGVYARLAALERAEGNFEASEKRLRDAIAIEPSQTLYQDLTDLLLDAGREAELAGLASEWKGPGADGAAAYARGQLLASQENLTGALVELERAFRLAPSDDNVEQALANTLSRLGRFEEAMRHYRAVLERSPCFLGALINQGVIQERFGRAEEAIRSYETAIRCDAGYANAYKNLGAALARNGDLRQALQMMRTAGRLAPEDRETAEAIAELESAMR